jgi:hypothetical protein
MVATHSRLRFQRVGLRSDCGAIRKKSVLWRKRRKRPAIRPPNCEGAMSAEFSVSLDKRGLLERFQIVRCGCPGAGRSLPYGKVNCEPPHEARTLQRQTVRCCESGTSQRWGHETVVTESVREREVPPKHSAGACGRAAAVGGCQGDHGNGEAGSCRHGVPDVSLAGWLHWLRRPCGRGRLGPHHVASL